MRRLQNKKQDNKKKYVKEKQSMWYEYLIEDNLTDSQLIPRDSIEILGIEEIFLSYLKNISSISINNKIKDFSNKYLAEHYRQLLKSKKWSIRMNTLYRINDFNIGSLLDECKRMSLKKLTMNERYELLKIYSKFDEDIFLKYFSQLTVAFSEYEYKKLLIDLKPEMLRKLMVMAEELPPDCQYSIIEVLGLFKDLDSIPYLESKLNHENPEVRIRVLKATNEIGGGSDYKKYLHFVDSEIWEERLMVAKLLNKFTISDVEVYLKKLLEDGSWLVRQEAIKGIKRLGVG